jgi:hypothetical protein
MVEAYHDGLSRPPLLQEDDQEKKQEEAVTFYVAWKEHLKNHLINSFVKSLVPVHGATVADLRADALKGKETLENLCKKYEDDKGSNCVFLDGRARYETAVDTVCAQFSRNKEDSALYDALGMNFLAHKTNRAVLHHFYSEWFDMYCAQSHRLLSKLVLLDKILSESKTKKCLLVYVGEEQAKGVAKALGSFSGWEALQEHHVCTFLAPFRMEVKYHPVFKENLLRVVSMAMEPLYFSCDVCSVKMREGGMCCTACKKGLYCGKECQKKAWKIHKKICEQSKVKV